MKPINFKQSNEELKAPLGLEEKVGALPVYSDPDEEHMVSCWEPSKEELEEIAKTGKIWLHIWARTTYPISLSGTTPWPEKKEVKGDG